jgi:uncharacterized membrane protein YhaH (DUF805 family)
MSYTKAFQLYAEFGGRTARKDFWLFFLVNCIVKFFLLVLPIMILIGTIMHDASSMFSWAFSDGYGNAAPVSSFLVFNIIWIIVGVIYGLAVFVPWMSLCVRRLHDLNLSGHWLWFIYGPMIYFCVSNGMAVSLASVAPEWIIIFGYINGFLFSLYMLIPLSFLILFCFKGTMGPNRFGDAPVEEYQASPSEEV